MRLRKALVLVMILLLLLPLVACRRGTDVPDPNESDPDETIVDPVDDPADPDETDDPDPVDDPDPEPPAQTTLAGIALGDPASKVTQLFGRLYQEDSYAEDEGYYGEAVLSWNYQDRVFFTIGQSSQKVLRIDVSVRDYETNLGVRVGDQAQTFLPLHRDLYEELVSIHTEETVPGWFLVEDGRLLIFFFNAGDETLFGAPIPDTAVVEGVTLAYGEHFD